jgi:hypothetical protein
MYKVLMMVKIDLTEKWYDVFNRDQSSKESVITIEDAKNYVTKYYSDMLGTFEFVETPNELYTISELDITCINC